MSTARSRVAICADLDALVQEPGFIYSLVWMLRHDLFLDPAEAADINWRDRLSFQEFTFLSGLLVKRPIDLAFPPADSIRPQIEQTYALFAELHREHESHWMERLVAANRESDSAPADGTDMHEELFGAGVVMTEPIFYSSSGAYDFQYWELAPRRYSLDSDWLREHKGLDVGVASQIVRAMKEMRRTPDPAPPAGHEGNASRLLETFCFSPDDFPAFDRGQVDALFASFSLEPGKVNANLTAPGQYNQVASHPLVRLSDGRHFLPVYFNLSVSLYESPFYWMLADATYRETSLQHRGVATESLVYDQLVSVFGSAGVYHGAKIYRGRRVVGEIDVLALLGGKALIVQCKSKRLTELARTGDTEQLKADFKRAVQDAYDQGLSCAGLLGSASGLRLEVAGVTVEWPTVTESFIACVVSDHYPAITHQVHTYLEKSADDPAPLALSVLDLDIVTFYLRDPFDFMYYVRQRTALAEVIRSDEEVALLAYHLGHKLYKGPGHDFEAVDSSFAQLIDAHFPAAKGYGPKTDAADRLHHRWRNPAFEGLLTDVKASGVPRLADAVFLLLDMSGDFADQLMAAIEKTSGRTAKDGKRHSFVMLSDEAESGVTFVSMRGDLRRLREAVLSYARARKYASKSKAWLGLGARPESPSAAEIVAFNNDPWRQDASLDRLTKVAMRPGTFVNPRRKYGRNEPCYCGSGLKYKRCHGRS